MIHTNELMLEDIVGYIASWYDEESGELVKEWEHPIPIKVSFITPDMVQYENEDGCYECADYELHPIPITPEILEKYGFVACQFWHEYKDGNVTIQVCIPSIRMKNGPCELEIKEGIHYVHELQHALRPCRIHKTFEL